MTAVVEPAGLCNARDLGGLPAGEGRVTRSGMLLRSDLPLPGDPAPDLPMWPPATVLDLRAPAERTGPHPLAGVREVPLFDDLMLGGAPDDGWPPDGDLDPWFARLYLRALRERAFAVAEAVSVLVTAPPPVLVHCAAGRDRTGIVVAVALRAIDVPRAAIVTDYRRTEDNHLRLMRRLAARTVPAGRRSGRAAVEALATPAAIEAVLDEVDSYVGGAHAWLVAHGVPSADLGRWRAEFVETSHT